jgi:sigma-54 dependent transcriptional regulator, acetoin dehydrogenase operon transcriptional activator AcoR
MRLTLAQWEEFFKSGKNPCCREDIFEHWQRSRKQKINQNGPKQPIKHNNTPDSSEETETFIHEVRKTIKPNLISRNPLKNAWIACDKNGIVLEIYAQNQELIDFFESISLTKGVELSGKNFGTHAISMAMKIKHGTLCYRYEHYCSLFHDFISIGSPIFNINGDAIGYVGIFCDHKDGIPQNLAMNLRLIIQSIDNKMRLQRLAHRYHCLQKLQDGLIVNDDTPTIIVSSKGYLRQINPAAANLLNLNNGVKEKALDKIAHFEPQIKSIASVGMEQKNIQMTINLDNKKIKVTADSYPCYSEKDYFLGVVITMSEKSSRQHINQEHNEKAIYTFDDIIGTSPALNNAKELAKQIAKSPISVLLTGESGTGKEMFAQSIHHESDFKDGPFVSINCSAIPRDLAESELFGYVKGAFTGALSSGRIGKLEAANNGTIFFDEIAEMPLELQAKLLRVLETKNLSRVGENKQRNINIRLIAATNQDLRQLIKEKHFREDLYYRIAVSHIHLPALNESKEDIPALFMNFVEYYNEQMGKKVAKVKEDLLKLLINYPWQGNIRELRNTAEYCVMMNPGDAPIAINHLPGDMRIPLLYPHSELTSPDPLYSERKSIEDDETMLLQKALAMADSNMTQTAKIMGISRATLYRKMKKAKM